jgi:hypothetical protein
MQCLGDIRGEPLPVHDVSVFADVKKTKVFVDVEVYGKGSECFVDFLKSSF